MRKKPGALIQGITAILTEQGPMTTTELCVAMNLLKDEVSSVLSRMKLTTPNRPQRVHIIGYTHDAEGSRRYPRAIYAIGQGENVSHPKANKKANRKRYEANKKKKINSVWMLGANRQTRKALGFPA